MGTKQINLKMSEELLKAAENYAKNYGYRNVQELASDSIREKIFEKSEFDEEISNDEIDMIDNLIELSIKKGDLVPEKELMKALE